MKTYFFKNILFIFICLFLFPFPSPTLTKAAKEDSKLYDYYELFGDAEATDLEETLREYSEDGEVDIIVITTDNLEGKSKQLYMEDFYDANAPGYDGDYGDAVLLMLYMNPNDRSVEIQGYKNAEHTINNQRIEEILDAIVPYLSNGEYVKALKEYAKLAAYYMNTEVIPPATSPSPEYNRPNPPVTIPDYNRPSPVPDYVEDPFRNPLVQLVVSLVLGGIAVAIMASHAGGRVTTTNRTYLNEEKSALIAHHDIYIRTTTKRVRKPKPQDNNHTGGGHTGSGVSGGGHSHSGGGRSF